MAAHAKLSASASDRWMRCAGSIQMCEDIEDTSSSYAMEGTAAHTLAEQCLRKGYDADQLIGETIRVYDDAEKKYVDYEATEEMAGYVQEYLDYVRCRSGLLQIEQRVDYSPWTSNSSGFGTADAVLLDDGVVRVIDLKYGENVACDVNKTYQLMLYGLGVINDFGSLYDIKQLELSIVQPRMDSITERTITYEDLLAWSERVIDAAKATEEENPPLVPGEVQCRFCLAKSICPALAAHKLEAICDGFESLEQPGERRKVETLTPEQLSAILPVLKGIDDYAKEVRAHATKLKLAGAEIEGHKLVLGSSKRYWPDEEAASKALCRKLGKSQAYEQTLISPTKAEKLLGKDSLLLKKHAFKPEGKPTIAHESDRRKEYTSSIADGFDILDEAA